MHRNTALVLRTAILAALTLGLICVDWPVAAGVVLFALLVSV